MSSLPPPYGYAPPPPRRRGGPVVLPVLLGLLAGWLVFTLMQRYSGGAAPAPARLKGAPADARAATARGALAGGEKATVELFERCSPSVVFITSLARRPVSFFEMTEVPQGAGSGFV